jgi:hypothetical protein
MALMSELARDVPTFSLCLAGLLRLRLIHALASLIFGPLEPPGERELCSDSPSLLLANTL